MTTQQLTGRARGDRLVADQPATRAERFRGDIAGLRAVAVGLVLVYHAGFRYLPGGFVGVDVFFVISGFLITRQLVQEIDRTGRVSLAGFYARRAKRILPAATTVLIATAVAVVLFVSRERWSDIGGDLLASALYFVNWRFADRAVDYLAAGVDQSPLQHFWSLAVEEQFYLVWPLLIIGAILVARRLRVRNLRIVLWLGLACIAVPSFAWSVHETAVSPDRAFFVSTTRMWELAIGAAIALVGSGLMRIPTRVAIVTGWLGLVAIVGSALLLTSENAWPGHLAAIPTLGAAAVIAAGVAAGPRGPVMLLGTRPFRWVGDLSYSLYLWHWPMIAIASGYFYGLSTKGGLAVVALSVIPAWLTFRFIENPVRHSRAISQSPRLALSIGGNLSLIGICAGLVVIILAGSVSSAAPAQSFKPRGAAVLLSPGVRPDDPVPDRVELITPDPLAAAKDLPDTTADKCFQQMVLPDLIWCEYGKPTGATTVALVGDSKADQWLPAFQELAEQNDWKLVVAFKGACPFTTATPVKNSTATLYPDCAEWNKALLQRLLVEKPDYVFTSQGSSRAADGHGGVSVELMVAGMRETWARLREAGIKVVVIANNPDPSLNVMQCTDANRNRLSACGYPHAVHDRDRALKTQRLAVEGTGVPMIDLFDAICPTVRCSPVIGNVLVYRRGAHLTATYVRSMSPQLATAMSDVGVPVRYTPPE